MAARRLAPVRVGNSPDGRERARPGRSGPGPLRQAQRLLRRARGGGRAGRACRFARRRPRGRPGDPRRRPAGARGEPARSPPAARGQARLRVGRELRRGARGRARGDRALADHRVRLLRPRLRRRPRTTYRSPSAFAAARPPRAGLADPGPPGGARDRCGGAAPGLREQRPAGNHARERGRRLRQSVRGRARAARGGVHQQRQRVAGRARPRRGEDRGGGRRGRSSGARGGVGGVGGGGRGPGAGRARGGGHPGAKRPSPRAGGPSRRPRRPRPRLRPPRRVGRLESEPPSPCAVRGTAAIRRGPGLFPARSAGAGGDRGGRLPRHVPARRVRARRCAGGTRSGPRGRLPGRRGDLRSDDGRGGGDGPGPGVGGPLAAPAAAPGLRRPPERHDRRRSRARGA